MSEPTTELLDLAKDNLSEMAAQHIGPKALEQVLGEEAPIEGRYIKRAPIFSSQIADLARTNSFKWMSAKSLDSMHEVGEMTEHEALVELQEFLVDFIDKSATNERFLVDPDNVGWADRAKIMLDSLTFIGEKEVAEATAFIAKKWKDYLAEDSEHQLCAVTKIVGNSSGEEIGGRIKSDQYVLERIFENFSDDEIKKYAERIYTYDSMERMTAPADKAKVFILDDWSVSGTQLKEEVDSLYSNPAFTKYIPSTEALLLVASDKQLSEGLVTEAGASLPIRSYFLANSLAGAGSFNQAHITGLHSTVDYGFTEEIETITRLLNKHLDRGAPQVWWPALAKVVSPYPEISLSKTHLVQSAHAIAQ